MSRFILVLTLAVGCLILGSCGMGNMFRRAAGVPVPNDVATATPPAQSLINFKQGREYAAQGRYELAKEQYLLAYAGSEDNGAMRDAAAREVQAMDMMIKTQR